MLSFLKKGDNMYIVQSNLSGRYIEFQLYFTPWLRKAKTFRRKKDAKDFVKRHGLDATIEKRVND